jgi:hypothetical protein
MRGSLKGGQGPGVKGEGHTACTSHASLGQLWLEDSKICLHEVKMLSSAIISKSKPYIAAFIASANQP